MPTESAPIVLGQGSITLEEALAIVHGAEVRFDESVAPRLMRGVELLESLLVRGTPIYGVTTGFGSSVDTRVDEADRAELALNLVRFHGCGTGRLFDEVETRAVLVARIASLVCGHSAVRPAVVELLGELLNRSVLPAIPCEGSVGASGDLTPLSYVAAVLLGEREVWFRGSVVPSEVVFSEIGLPKLVLRPKESLALMNGTSVMTGLALLATERAWLLSRFAALLTAVSSFVLEGQPGHFDERLFELKPHPGQALFASWVREELGARRAPAEPLQDRYSLRCAPHVAGVTIDEILLHRAMLETELGSVNDNPIVDVDSERVLHGGHFYGGHVCQFMDTLKTCVANLADLVDRQLLLLCDPAANRGLPGNLVAARPAAAHHGFKAMQITSSALVAEACKASMPASVFSRSTENHNQDKVSLGTIAARDCLRVIELSERVLSIHALALAQAFDLRAVGGCPGAERLHQRIRASVPMNDGDRRMDHDIERVLRAHRSGELFDAAVSLQSFHSW